MQRERTLQRDKRNGNFCVQISHGGIRKYFPLGKNKRQAKQVLREFEKQIAAGNIHFSEKETTQTAKPDGTKDIRIEELIHEYLESLRSTHAESTFQTRKMYMNDFYSFVGECMVSSITPLTLLKYYAATRNRIIEKRTALKRKNPDKKDEIFTSDNAGNMHLRHVKELLKWGQSMGMYKCSFEKFPAIKESPARLISPKAEDVERLLMKMPQDLRDMAGFHVLTGCRPQELVGLKKEDLHRENGQAFFVVKPKSEKLMRQPKPRIIALSRSPLDIVIRAVNQHPDSHTIFVNEDGKPYTTSTYRQRLQRWCKRAGIRRLPPYALRHFFGTHQAGIGTNNQVLSQIMGHTTTRTLSRYVEPVPEYQQKAMEDHEQNMRRLLKNSFDECKVETESTADSTAKPVGGTQEASEDAATPCKKAS